MLFFFLSEAMNIIWETGFCEQLFCTVFFLDTVAQATKVHCCTLVYSMINTRIT